MPELREDIKSDLQSLISQPLRQASLSLLATLGYRSDRTLELEGSKPQAFLDLVQSQGGSKFDPEKACFSDWKSADILFQLTDEDLAASSSLFKETDIKSGLLRSYLFFAIELKGGDHSRSKLSAIARQINRVFPMPVMVLLKHDRCLSIAVINRRQNKLHADKDVLEKVTLIRDISLIAPHRGHLEILQSIAFSELEHPKKLPIRDFDTLHAAWEQIFNIELLNNRFYKELSNWYFWAVDQVNFPDDLEKDDDKRRATGLIRLLTRLIFCWFLKEKDGLIPSKLFDKEELEKILKGFDPESETSSTYYLAILQNLFFATLNQRMGKDSKGNPYRVFAKDEGFLKNKSTYDVNNLYRYENLFAVPEEEALALFADIPFLNGGLFECLDRTEDGTDKKIYLDGFSRNPKKRPHVPDRLFFDSGETADLSAAYGDKKRRSEKVTGLISILNRYKFTIVENTPIDQEIALDPELLGKVFENLLASYNEETKTTARKQTGSFYTPRPIVDYMVDESLKAHLERKLVEGGAHAPSRVVSDAPVGNRSASPVDSTPPTEASQSSARAPKTAREARALPIRERLDHLFAYTEDVPDFSELEKATLIAAIDDVKILDPACGSGAFPMGVLHKLVYILGKLDPDNERWKQTQLAKLDSAPMREALEATFEDNNDDYGRKLYLIENCLYGVDIQPIAIQITKLRFFISLVCDQKTNRNKKENHGIRPLPNLETKFVAADTLIGLPISDKDLFIESLIAPIEKEIEDAYHGHFTIQRRDQKLALQKRIKALRLKLAETLAGSLGAVNSAKAKHLAEWDPFDPQSTADFFDPHWMFGRSLKDGFDIVMGNPPYVPIQKFSATQKGKWATQDFRTMVPKADIYCLFFERGAQLLRESGHLCYITSNKWMRAGYGENLRDFFIKQNQPKRVVDFGGVVVFNSATVDSAIVLTVKAKPATTCETAVISLDYQFTDSLADFIQTKIVSFTLPPDGAKSWVVVTPQRNSIKSLVESQGVPLKQWDLKISSGVKTSHNDAFIVDQDQYDAFVALDPASASKLHRILRGQDIKRYQLDWKNYYVIGTFKQLRGSYSIDDYPAIKSHLLKFREELEPLPSNWDEEKRGKWKGRNTQPFDYLWYEVFFSPDLEVFRQTKIIFPNMTKFLPFYLDADEGYFGNQKSFAITSDTETLTYLTAYLNSSLFRCCFIDNFPNLGEDRRELSKIYFDKIPVKKPTAAEVSLYERLVRLIQFAKAEAGASPGAAAFLEDLIDACVMESYFREHMAERDLLFHDTVAPHLAAYAPAASAAQQRDFLTHLHQTLNAPSHPMRQRLDRIVKDSPDLLAIIKQEGKV